MRSGHIRCEEYKERELMVQDLQSAAPRHQPRIHIRGYRHAIIGATTQAARNDRRYRETSMETQTILLDQSAGLLTITLNQPEILNALDLPQWHALARAFERARDDASIRALVITGAGRAFSAGADVRAMRERGAAEQIARLELIGQAVQLLAELPKPTIAAVNGVAAGISASLAFACDLAIAAEGASFAFSWIKLGLAADGGGSWLLARLVGPRRAKELIMTARRLSATEALAWGLVNEVVADGQALERALALAGELSAFSPHALRHDKALIEAAATSSLEAQLAAERQAQAECVESAEFRAAVAAFLAGRLQAGAKEGG
jgi:2-(1,2-epoxy-1,2-dihydrophenyl)acetyl-CoA isomerase